MKNSSLLIHSCLYVKVYALYTHVHTYIEEYIKLHVIQAELSKLADYVCVRYDDDATAQRSTRIALAVMMVAANKQRIIDSHIILEFFARAFGTVR